jgi:hypothetical protein
MGSRPALLLLFLFSASLLPGDQDPTEGGTFAAYLEVDGRMQRVASLAFGKDLRTRRVDIGRELPDEETEPRLVLSQEGGGAAHLDSVLLDGCSPRRLFGTDDSLSKIQKRDLDVIDAHQKQIGLVFPAGKHSGLLEVTGRIEGTAVSKTPFHFPLVNTFRDIDEQSSFYTYDFTASKGDLLFKEYCVTGSGHPSGFTYGEVWNDDRNLYVTIDFTPDNTRDGLKDYASVWVRSPAGIEEFRVSEGETTWGSPSFTYTDRVAYQHKVYDFAVPLSRIGGLQQGELRLAFSAYGTASPGLEPFSPEVAHDPVNNRYLVVVDKGGPGLSRIYGQLLEPDGTLLGSEFAIGVLDNHVAASAAFDPVSERYLVIWDDMRDDTYSDVYGQLVDADGALVGGNFNISQQAGTTRKPNCLVYDRVNQRFFVVWNGASASLDVFGQIVDSDGRLIGNRTPIATSSDSEYVPAVQFNPHDDGYFVVWGNTTKHLIEGRRLTKDGFPFLGDSFTILETGNDQQRPTLALNETDSEYLVAWQDNADTLLGAICDHAGTPIGTAFTICDAGPYYGGVSAAYNPEEQRYLVVWLDYRNQATEGTQVWGQYVGRDGQLMGGNLQIDPGRGDQGSPWGAYNPTCGCFLVATENNDAPPPVVNTYLLGTEVPAVSADLGSWTFDTTHVGGLSSPKTITLSNICTSDLLVSSVTLGGANPGDFVLQNDDCTGQTIAMKASRTLQVVFSPGSEGEKSAVLSIVSNDPSTPTTSIALRGTGENTPPAAARLVFPTNGLHGFGAEVTFIWKEVTDDDADAVSYYLYVGESNDFSQVEPVEVTSSPRGSGLSLAAMGTAASLSIAGLLLGKKRRRFCLPVLLIILVSLGLLAGSCTPPDGVPPVTPSVGPGEMSTSVAGLKRAVTYYWRVVVDDGLGGRSESDVFAFTTQ